MEEQLPESLRDGDVMVVTRIRFLWVMLFYHNIFKLETQGHGRPPTWGNLAVH